MLHFPASPPLSLYIHLPWCVRKCPYCDFNSHALRGELPEQEYLDALLRDLEAEAARAAGRPVVSIFIGGGTPSLFSPRAIEQLLGAVHAQLTVRPEAEITLEANPGTIEQDRFAGFRAAGVNRLSIGIQSFADAQLRSLGRIHDGAEALQAVAGARQAGFDNFNLDLMYGLPQQDLAGALADLEQALALQPSHISHYQLTLEPNTLFHARPPAALPDEDLIFSMQQACQARLAEAGYRHYEISAYALPDRESRHNLNYWAFGDYLALGAGAHGKLTDCTRGEILRYAKRRHPRDYQLHAGHASIVDQHSLVSPEEVVLEFMMNALRLREGFSIALCEAHSGLPWTRFEPLVAIAVERGWLSVQEGWVRPTVSGYLYLNELLELFVPEPA